MRIEEAFRLELTETSGVTSTVSQDRIFLVKAPIDVAAPYIVVHSISNVPVRPYTNGVTGKSISRIQVSVFASTYTACKTLTTAIRAAFDGFYGVMGTAGVTVGVCLFDNEFDIPFEDSPLQLYGVGQDYLSNY